MLPRLTLKRFTAGVVSLVAFFPVTSFAASYSLQPQTGDDTLMHQGIVRTYRLHLPTSYKTSGPLLPLVIALHGGGGSGQQFEIQSGLSDKADRAGFIVVYPDGLPNPGPLRARSWNAGTCCGHVARRMQVDDVAFIRQLIEWLVRTQPIDPRRVYATGHSNGAMLCFRLACELSDKLAAIATNAGTLQVQTPCRPARVVPLLHMHSSQDRHVPYEGGFGQRSISRQWNPSVDSSLRVFARLVPCADVVPVAQKAASYILYRWESCPTSSEIRFYLTSDGGHSWPGGNATGRRLADPPSTALLANDLLWTFFRQHRLP